MFYWVQHNPRRLSSLHRQQRTCEALSPHRAENHSVTSQNRQASFAIYILMAPEMGIWKWGELVRYWRQRKKLLLLRRSHFVLDVRSCIFLTFIWKKNSPATTSYCRQADVFNAVYTLNACFFYCLSDTNEGLCETFPPEFSSRPLTSGLNPKWTQKDFLWPTLSCQKKKNPKKPLRVWSFRRVAACQCFPPWPISSGECTRVCPNKHRRLLCSPFCVSTSLLQSLLLFLSFFFSHRR